ncbi:thioredoxin family protein [Streptomyces sp. NPDC089919]|uniref:thioredoxin family protein n=1 Tax=Streptomyces sp. NPDC089919 TaxID=3155188 RepID=UPI003427310E
MSAHRRRPRTSRIPGFVRFSAVSLTVAGAAFTAAHLGGQTRDGGTESVSAALAPEVPATEDAASDPQPQGSPAGQLASPAAAASAAARTRPSAAAPAPAPAPRTADPTRRAGHPDAAAKTPAPRPPAPSKPDTGSTPKGDSGFRAGYDSGTDARKAVKAAIAAAKADGKKVLIDFGANWCGNCKAADKTFGKSSVGAILDASYHVVKVDIGSQNSDNFDLLRSYCSGEGAYKMPVLVVLDGNGKLVTETHSTGNPDLGVDGLSAFLRQWA